MAVIDRSLSVTLDETTNNLKYDTSVMHSCSGVSSNNIMNAVQLFPTSDRMKQCIQRTEVTNYCQNVGIFSITAILLNSQPTYLIYMNSRFRLLRMSSITRIACNRL